MAEEIGVVCPGCSAEFSVPSEFCGEMAECTECNIVFEIPTLEKAEILEKTEKGAIKVDPPPENYRDTATHTVKLSRSGIGMKPSLKERFEFGTKAPPPPKSLD